LSLSRNCLLKCFDHNLSYGTYCQINVKRKMAVSKSALPKDQDKRIGRGRKLSGYQMILLSNNIVREPVERRRFQSRYHRILMSLEICQGTARGQFKTTKSIFTNGPAIWGGCVTRRSIRAGSCYFSQKTVTVQALPAGRQGGYGALFAVRVQIFVSITRVAPAPCE
jgi:hypothetical protein